MTDLFRERCGDLLTGSHDCVDRIVLNAYFSLGHSPGGFRVWWRRWHGDGDQQLDNAHLMRLAGRFARRVRASAQAHGIPVIDCKAEDRKHQIAEEYLAEHPWLYEELSSFDARAGTRHRPTVADDHVGLIRGRLTNRRSSMTDVRNVVLVHGGFVDGSGWQGVYDLLTADGFNVSVVQNQTLSLESDVETTHNVLDLQDGPAILVGHSYGGAVITEAGTHDSVACLVYITAFAPDQGESVSSLLATLPPDGPVPPILPPVDGFLFLDHDKFPDSFAADVPAREAAFMADSQVPWGVEALGGTISDPAWRHRPSWYLLVSDDRMIPPPLQRQMAERAGATTAEVSGSHAIYVSQPAAVANLITQAARSLHTATSMA